MKKFYILFFTLGVLAIACSDNNTIVLPGIPEITGDNANVCPAETVALSITATANAVSYQWYQDGVAISGATTTVYEVTTSGTYNVAGVNQFGEGARSADKVVEITECPFIYKLLGEWTVNEYIFTSGWDKFSHKFEISFVDATTVEITGWSSYEQHDWPIRATVNSTDRTISLGGRQELIPTPHSLYRAWICPMANNATACNGWGLTFPAATVTVTETQYTVQIIGAGTYNPTIDGESRRGSYGIVGSSGTLTITCAGHFAYAAGTVWTKDI